MLGCVTWCDLESRRRRGTVGFRLRQHSGSPLAYTGLSEGVEPAQISQHFLSTPFRSRAMACPPSTPLLCLFQHSQHGAGGARLHTRGGPVGQVGCSIAQARSRLCPGSPRALSPNSVLPVPNTNEWVKSRWRKRNRCLKWFRVIYEHLLVIMLH